ncbi:hypothetical protein CEN47_10990 [Fischerella thermalis CCMEE 5319]|nr:hypothetical protein CEN47_10990 [Fischerella thermalis CCMEE 5319]
MLLLTMLCRIFICLNLKIGIAGQTTDGGAFNCDRTNESAALPDYLGNPTGTPIPSVIAIYRKEGKGRFVSKPARSLLTDLPNFYFANKPSLL